MLVHGFCGTTNEVLPLYHALRAHHMPAFLVHLAGHDGTRQTLRQSDRFAWVASAEEEFLRLRQRYKKIILIGFSMGGLICAQIAAKYGCAGLILISTPVFVVSAKGVLCEFRRSPKGAVTRYWQNAQRCTPKAVRELMALLRATWPKWGLVQAPTLIIQALDDDSAHPVSGVFLHKHISGPSRLCYLAQGGHRLLLSGQFNKIYRCIRQFVKQLLQASSIERTSYAKNIR